MTTRSVTTADDHTAALLDCARGTHPAGDADRDRQHGARLSHCPAIAEDFRPAASTQLWIVDVYSLVLAALLVAMGSLGDRIGRRRMLMIGAALSSRSCPPSAAFAPTAEMLVLARAVLGFFGAMLMPSTLSLIRNIFTEASARRLAIAIWASCFTAGSTLGPIVGGALLEHFHWGSVFLIAVPILLPLLILAPQAGAGVP